MEVATENKLATGLFLKMRTCFAVSVAAILLFTALAKIVAIAQHKPFLALNDPIITIFRIKDSIAMAAFLEVVVATFMLLKRQHLTAMVACSWLSVIFLCYRLLKRAVFYQEPCHCLGTIFDWTGIPQSISNAIPVILLWYMGVGSLFFLFVSNVPASIWQTFANQNSQSNGL
jgi:hypothetical protein